MVRTLMHTLQFHDLAEMEIAHMPKLIFMCGKMAAGKTTLSRELAAREDAVLLVQRVERNSKPFRPGCDFRKFQPFGWVSTFC